MSFCRGIEIIGCTKPQRRILTHVDLNEPKMIGLDINECPPFCTAGPNSLPIVDLKVSNRDGIIIVDGDKVADVHLECPEIRCPFHQDNKKRVENCFTIFPLSVRPNGHSVCFAQYYVAKNLPSEVDLVSTEGGFRCSQHDCPLNRYYGTINHQP